MAAPAEPGKRRRLSCPIAAVSELAPPPETAQACWEIRGYSRREKKKGECIESGAIVEAAGARFGLQVYFGGNDKSSEGYIAMYCQRIAEESEAEEVSALPNIALIGMEDQVIQRPPDTVKVPKIFYRISDLRNDRFSKWGYPDFCATDKLESSSYLVDDTLVIRLQVTVWGSGHDQDRHWKCPAAPGSLHSASARRGGETTWAKDWAAFFASGRATDVELRGSLGEDNEQVVKAHRVVLAARSPVFDRMLLESGMRESEAGAKISLDGVDHKIAEKFVLFLYTDELDQESRDSPDDLCYLLTLAHRFEVRSLTELCVASLTLTITEENAIDRLAMGEQFGLQALKEQAMNFLCSCRKRLAGAQKTDAFAKMAKDHPALMTELFLKATSPA